MNPLPIPGTWIYPDQVLPPSGMLALLTIGNAEVIGSWSPDGRYKAWQYLFDRDKEHEAWLKLNSFAPKPSA